MSRIRTTSRLFLAFQDVCNSVGDKKSCLEIRIAILAQPWKFPLGPLTMLKLPYEAPKFQFA